MIYLNMVVEHIFYQRVLNFDVETTQLGLQCCTFYTVNRRLDSYKMAFNWLDEFVVKQNILLLLLHSKFSSSITTGDINVYFK